MNKKYERKLNTLLIKMFSATQRPFLYQKAEIEKYVFDNFKVSAHTKNLEIQNFLNDIENLLPYKSFFGKIQEETAHTGIKISFKFLVSSHNLPSQVFNDIKALENIERNSVNFIDKTFAQSETERIRDRIYYKILGEYFSVDRKFCMIFINGKHTHDVFYTYDSCFIRAKVQPVINSIKSYNLISLESRNYLNQEKWFLNYIYSYYIETI